MYLFHMCSEARLSFICCLFRATVSLLSWINFQNACSYVLGLYGACLGIVCLNRCVSLELKSPAMITLLELVLCSSAMLAVSVLSMLTCSVMQFGLLYTMTMYVGSDALVLSSTLSHIIASCPLVGSCTIVLRDSVTCIHAPMPPPCLALGLPSHT